MKIFSRTVSAMFATVFVTTASTAAAQSAPSAERSACLHDQAFSYLSPGAMEQRKMAFRARNKGVWAFGPNDVNITSGAIQRAERTDGLGRAVVGLDKAAVARSFLLSNLDLLSVSQEDVKVGSFSAGPLTLQDSVRFTSTRVVPGTEGYRRPVTRGINLVFQIATDGTVYRYQAEAAGSEMHVSKLCTRPATRWNDPVVLRNILGSPLIHRKREYVETTPPVPLGNVELADIRSGEPDIALDPENDAYHYRVVWRIQVERKGYKFWFEVAALDGRLLRTEEGRN